MYTHNRKDSPRRERSELVSQILLQWGDLPEVGLTATWVGIAPGSRQRPHHPPSEQVYVITAGKGRMLVGEEEQEVSAGDIVYIPSGAIHSIENASTVVLTYISAATPALHAQAAYDTGQLRPEGRGQNGLWTTRRMRHRGGCF